MIKIGDSIESKNPIKVTISKKVKGIVYKVEKQAFGTFVYFETEEGELKCFKKNQVVKINEGDKTCKA